MDNWNGSYYDPAGILNPPQQLGASDWTLVQSNTTNWWSTTQAVLTFTYQGALNRGDCVTLGASVDVDTNCFGMRITHTPQMSYTVSAVQSGYTTSGPRIIWHSNDTV